MTADQLTGVQRMAAPKPGARARPAAPNPLLNPNQPLQGKSLQTAAQALTDAQVKAPLAELARMLAQQNRQGAAAQKLSDGYFNQLGQYAKAGSQQEGQIASGLNQQLAGIQNDTQSRLAGFGQQATQTPGLQSLAATGLDGGALGNLAAETARQQGLAAQNAQTFRSAGANQGANYQGLAAQNLGVYGLRGQERLGNMAQATRLANEPILSKMAGLQASKGALLATNEGKLRQQEISNSITKAGIQAGLTKAQISAMTSRLNNQNSVNSANQRAANALSQQKMLADRTFQLNKQKLGLAKATQLWKQQHPNAGRSGSGGSATTGAGGVRPLTASGNNAYWSHVAQGIAAVGRGRQQGQSPDQIKNALLGAGMTPLQAQTAVELWVYHYISPSTAAQLHRAGVRGGTYAGQPIRVGAPPKSPPALHGSLFGVPI